MWLERFCFVYSNFPFKGDVRVMCLIPDDISISSDVEYSGESKWVSGDDTKMVWWLKDDNKVRRSLYSS